MTFIVFYSQSRLKNLFSREDTHLYAYTGHNFDIPTLVVLFLGLKILCSIRIVLEATINNDTFEFAVLT